MNDHYRYPDSIDICTGASLPPELIPIWNDAMSDLRARRNRMLLWQAPAAILLLLITVSIFGALAVFVIGLYMLILGLVAQCTETDYNYTVSDDRQSARFHLKHRWSPKSFFNVPIAILLFAKERAKEGPLGLFVAAAVVVTLPFGWLVTTLLTSFFFLNDVWWLKEFEQRTASLMKKDSPANKRQHIRGNEILPSVKLTGSAPHEGDPATPSQPLEVLDGMVTLHSDGRIIIAGGGSFDQHATFSGFVINGLSVTRESPYLMKASRDGCEYTFRFDGASWKEV